MAIAHDAADGEINGVIVCKARPAKSRDTTCRAPDVDETADMHHQRPATDSGRLCGGSLLPGVLISISQTSTDCRL